MKQLRPLLVVLTSVALLAAPGAVSASAAPPTEPFATRVFFDESDHVRAYGSVTAIRGQILSDHGGPKGEGSIVATVDLLRRYKGSPTWEAIRRATTTDPNFPEFLFEVRTNANAFYRVVYAGDDRHQPSAATTEVSAYRTISTKVKPKLLQMYGTVAPRYAGKRLYVERKNCATCKFKRIRSTVVNANSNYKVTLAAPNKGQWFFRLASPASAQFITSYTGVVKTSRG